MKKFTVKFLSGQSRYSNKIVDYMIAEGEGIKLYAETSDDDDYSALKAKIIERAVKLGLTPNQLKFWEEDEKDKESKLKAKNRYKLI